MSLRARILVLVFLSALAPAALLAYHLFQQRGIEIEHARASLRALTDHAGELLDGKTRATVQLLHGLSRAYDLDAAGAAACSGFLAEVLSSYPQYTKILAIGSDGQRQCDSLRTGRKLNLADREYFKRARTTGRPAVEAAFGSPGGTAALDVAYPRTSGGGERALVLLASLNLAEFARDIFLASGAGPGIQVVLWDSGGTLMAREPDTGLAKLVGRNFADSELFRAAAPGDRTELRGPDGEPRIWAVSAPRKESGDLRIAIGVPVAELTADADRNLKRSAAIVLAVLALATFGAAAIAEVSIRRQAMRVVQAARRVGAGDLDARIGAPYPSGELGDLMAAVDRTAGQLQAQRLEIERDSALLRQSEERYRRTFEYAGVGFAHVGLDGRLLRVNRAFCGMLGYASEDIAGRSVKEITHAEDRELADPYNARLAEGRSEVERFEKRFLRKDGGELWTDVTIVLMRDGAGAPAYIVSAITDISERRLAEEALRASEMELRTLAESMPQIVWITRPDGWTVYINQQWMDYTGRTLEESLGHGWIEPFHPDDRQAARQAWQKAVATLCDYSVESRLRRADGEYRWWLIRGVPQRDAAGGVLKWFGTCTDIHDLKTAHLDIARANQALGESEMRFRRVLEVNAEPTLLTDETGTILLANPAAAQLIGRNETSLVGSPLGLPVDDGRPAEVSIVRPDGSTRLAEMRFARAHIGGQVSLVISLHDLSERKKYEGRIEFLANHDALTGLPNRNLLRDRAEQAISQARRAGRQLALLFVDLDRFKLINDSWGHPFGDALLVQVSGRLSGTLREGDTLARLGGDEFVILLPELPSADKAIVVADKVLAALAQPFEVDARSVPMTASLGIAAFPRDGETLEALLQSADAAMYRAKELGRAGFQFYSEDMGKNARERAELEAGLYAAVERGELALHYQPQIDLATRRIVGFEALMRWTRAGAGPVSPARFIPIAEESGLIVTMGDWALRTAARQAAAWRDAGLGRYRIAVNLSARQFWKGLAAGSVAAALAESGAEPDLLEVEITEGVVLRDVNEVMRSLAELRRTGVTVAIDDFGTGYSSLAYLRSLPIDKLKIDKAFLEGTPEDRDACAFVAELIQFAHVLKLIVVAEGVEQEAQAAFLRSAGCERIQGFLFAPALPASQCEPLLRRSGTDLRQAG